MGERTIDDLKQLQALPLHLKVSLTKSRIRQWVNEFGTDGVYVSFSGGKDSTVLLHLVRELYPEVPAVFCDTGLEYPEIREFVKTFDNVVWLKPKMTFRKVIEKYGYPFISKEVSECVEGAKKYLTSIIENESCKDLKMGTTPKSELLELLYDEQQKHPYQYEADRMTARSKIMLGKLEHKEKGELTNEYSEQYNKSRYKFLLDAPFEVSNKCCNIMKKGIVKKYAKETGRVGITGQMASESMLRKANWIKYGCNMFEAKTPISNPMSFWTEQDVLQYIKENDIEICSVYGDIVVDEEVDGQMRITDFGMNEVEKPKYKTTGCNRTGCMFCGFGCHLEKEGEGRFERMKVTHPKQYEWIMKPWDEGGLGYKEVIDWINEHGNLRIRY